MATIVKWALDCIIDLYKVASDEVQKLEDDLYETGSENISPELAHYAWLAEAFSKLFDKKIDQSFSSEFQIFILKNKFKIDKIMGMAGVPKYLGRGREGIAMSMGANYAFKIFLDDGVYTHTKAAMERLHADPEIAKTEAMIYDVDILGEFLNQKIYFSIVELMKTIKGNKDYSTRLNSIINTVLRDLHSDRERWDSFKEKFNTKDGRTSVLPLIIKEISAITSIVISTNKEEITYLNDSDLKLKSSWISSLVEEIVMKFLTSRTDTHLGNIGVTNFGEFRYFDPVASSNSLDRIMGVMPKSPNQDDETVIP